jgi:DNA-binding winged helix-turn-helix (wHTH) protein
MAKTPERWPLASAIQALVIRQRRLSPLRLSLSIAAMVAAALVLLQLLGETVDEVDAGLIYALLTLLFAIHSGWRAGLVAAGVSCILLNYVFMEPVFGFAISKPKHILALPIYLGVALIGASLRGSDDTGRESGGVGTESQRSAGLQLDFDAQQVFVDGRRIHLTPTEIRLLEFLAASPGRLLRPQSILNQVWGEGYVQDSHLLRTYINQLRSKLGDDAAQPRFISTEPGFGYRFLKQPSEI